MVLRGAISGFGEVAAQAHLAGWRSRPGISIVAIHDPVAPRRHHAINLIRNIRVYDDLQLMLDGEALDFIDIASPPALHAEAAALALEAGANVLVEKPLCLDPGDFNKLAAIAERNRRVLMCVHNWKHSPAYLRAYELVKSGRLGRVGYLSLVRMRNRPAGANASAERWRLEAKTGGGILIDHGWHTFYLAQWLMGDEQPVSVSAILGSYPYSEVEDLADMRIEFQGGRIAYVHLSWRSPVRRTAATLCGSSAILEIEGDRLTLIPRQGPGEDHSVIDAPDDSYHAGWFAGIAADFESALKAAPERELMRANLREAEAALALMNAARESAVHGGQPIRVHGP